MAWSHRGRRGRKTDPEWAQRSRMVRAAETLTDEEPAKLHDAMRAADPSGGLEKCWQGKEKLRRLLALAGTEPDRNLIWTRLTDFYTHCADSEVAQLGLRGRPAPPARVDRSRLATIDHRRPDHRHQQRPHRGLQPQRQHLGRRSVNRPWVRRLAEAARVRMDLLVGVDTRAGKAPLEGGHGFVRSAWFIRSSVVRRWWRRRVGEPFP